ncbi:MAG: hypothetical protein LAN64_12245 [Acidobacteriia bacterium]|nr:hypothetical protein [Terriglobia bacterium]
MGQIQVAEQTVRWPKDALAPHLRRGPELIGGSVLRGGRAPAHIDQ